MKSTLIDMIDKKAIVKLEKAGHIEWLVCRDYDDSKPEGTKWSSAQYFYSLADAVKYAEKEDTLYLVSIVSDEEYDKDSYVIVKGKDKVFEYLKTCLDVLRYNYSEDAPIVKDYAEALEKLKDTNSVHVEGVGFISYSEYELGEEIRL